MQFLIRRLALSLVLTSIAHSAVFWTDGEPSSHLWTDTANWNTGSLPTPVDEVQFNTANTSAEINPGIVAETGNFILGRHALTTNLTVTGGSLTTGGTLFMIGQYFDASGSMTPSSPNAVTSAKLSTASSTNSKPTPLRLKPWTPSTNRLTP